MPQIFPLGYGTSSFDVDLGGVDVLAVLQPRHVDSAGPSAELIAGALQSPIGSPPLAEVASGARTAAILVSGKDRVTGAETFMHPLVEALLRAGVPKDGITVFMATGTHIPFRAGDRDRVLGPDLDPAVRVVGHDCEDVGGHVDLGPTSLGNQVVVNRAAYEHDVKVLTGRITHHYFAGFTAGRKAVLPGVSARSTIEFNHRLVMSGANGHPRHPMARNGQLEGNPIHEDMLEGARLFEPTFVLNTVVDTGARVTHAFGGDPYQAHAEGCQVVADLFEVPIDRPAELVVGSPGGDPYDCSFVQALKTLMNTHEAVADGGAYLLLAECPEGIKPEFLAWDRHAAQDQLAHMVRTHYNLTGHNTWLLREILERITVVLVSSCPQGEVGLLGLQPASTWREGLDLALRAVGTSTPSTHVVPFGNVTVVRPP
ncbi:MAG TPA: nickel-dependent lactate racemase [Actinomycetota bacterium]|nr:nickel-dependent lactate racemase [Actinomycetota bacterium]